MNINLLNNYYNFDNKEQFSYIPKLTENIIIKFDEINDKNINNLKFDIKIIKKIPKNLKKLGYNNDIYKKVEEFQKRKWHIFNFKDCILYPRKVGYIHPFTTIDGFANPFKLYQLHHGPNYKVLYPGHTEKKSYELTDKIYKEINNYNKKIFIYKKLLITTYRHLYLINKFKLINNIFTKKVLILTNNINLSAIEDILTYIDFYINKINKMKVHLIFFTKHRPKSMNDIKLEKESIKILKERFNFTVEYNNNDFCINNLELKNKYDYIDCNMYLYVFDYKKQLETFNSQNYFNIIYNILKLLNIKGNIKFDIKFTYSEFFVDIIYILSLFFKEVYLIKHILSPKYNNYSNIIAKNFKGISDNNLKKLKKIKDKWEKFNNKYCGLKKYNNKKFIKSIIKNNSYKKKIFIKLKYFNNILSQFIFNYFIKLKEYYNNIIKFDKKKDLYKYINNIIKNNYLICKSLYTNIFPVTYNIDYNINFNEYYTSKKGLYYEFNNIQKNKYIKIKNINKYLEVLNKNNNKLNLIKRSIDTRIYKKYNEIKYKINIFNNIKKIVSSKIRLDVSQAFLKMLEILISIDFKKYLLNNNNFNFFSQCEAPGNFIMAINYYFKNNTNIKNINWKAQSLNPNKYKNAFGDDYGIINKYKDRWLFGTNDTNGDLTDINTIEYLKNNININIDFISSDCGLRCNNIDEMINQENYMTQLNISQIYSILTILQKGGSCIFKTFIPQLLPINISINYLLYKSFDKIFFTKPILNEGSSEFYIVCIHYKKNNKKYLEIIKNILIKIKDLNYNNKIVNKIYKKYLFNKISNNFITQYTCVLNNLIKQHSLYILRNLYYYDNPDKIDLDKYNINNIKKIKYNEWCNNYL